MRTPRNARTHRRGAVLIEAALVMSVLLTLIFGLIEFGHYFYTQHNLKSAAEYGARLGILRTKTASDAKSAAETQMTSLGYSSSEFTATATIDDATKIVTVKVEATWGTIGVRPFGMIPASSVLRGQVVMRREGF